MRSDDPRFRSDTVDGQRLVFPSADAWREVLAGGLLDGRPIGVGRLAEQLRALELAVTGPVTVLGEDATPGKPWWALHVVRVEERWQRVRVEGQSCERCGLELLAGNHRVLAVYLGTDDPLARLRERWDAPQAKCPECAEPLALPAVWAARAP